MAFLLPCEPQRLLELLRQNPSPWVGAIIGALITGGLFGYIAYARSIRPVLMFFRKEPWPKGIWKLQNLGPGVAAHVIIRDFGKDGKEVANCRTYPIQPNDDLRQLNWVQGGSRLVAEYTDIFGHRRYRTECREDENHFKRRFPYILWFAPSTNKMKSFQREIDLVEKQKALRQN